MEEARARGKHVIFNPSGVDRQTELDVLHGSFSTLTDGLIFSPLHLNTSDAADIHVDYHSSSSASTCGSTPTTASGPEHHRFRNATARLIELGCQRIAIIGVHEWGRTTARRRTVSRGTGRRWPPRDCPTSGA